MSSDVAYCRAMARFRRAQQREEMRQQIDDARCVVKAFAAKGIPMRTITIAGNTYELGEPEREKKTRYLTPLEEWKAKRNARQT